MTKPHPSEIQHIPYDDSEDREKIGEYVEESKHWRDGAPLAADYQRPDETADKPRAAGAGQ